MKKKFSLFLGTVISLIASIFSSATASASACGGPMGPMEYIPPKAYVEEKSYVETEQSSLVTTLQNGKTTVVLTSYPAEKSYAGSKVSIDGVEMMMVNLPKADTPEKQRILKAIKEMGCLMVKNPDMQDSEEKIKAIFKKYGFKTDDKSMEALEAKYANDTVFMSQVEKAARSCGGISF